MSCVYHLNARHVLHFHPRLLNRESSRNNIIVVVLSVLINRRNLAYDEFVQCMGPDCKLFTLKTFHVVQRMQGMDLGMRHVTCVPI